ncbi:toxin-antitoxin system TumE family protein [Haladaptatus sp. NG-WS-4]
MTEGGATKVLDIREYFPENDTHVDVDAYTVTQSDRYPEGVKYSMQYGTTDGTTIVRYDNFPDHPDAAHHHKHTEDGGVIDVDFDGLRPLFEQFRNEVQNHGEHWG